jgi:hypothetical protein
VLPVQLARHPASGGAEEFNAVMTITCLVGDRIPVGAEESVEFDISGRDRLRCPVSGENLFVKENVNKNKRNE